MLHFSRISEAAPPVALAGLLILGACAVSRNASYVSSNRPSAAIDGPPAFRTQWHDMAAAWTAEKAQNYIEAMRLWRQIDAEPAVGIAFAGVPLTGPYTDQNRSFHVGNSSLAGAYPEAIVRARQKIAVLPQRENVPLAQS